MFLKLDDQAGNVALVFFAVYCLLIGCLILGSRFLPRFLGALMVLAGLGWLTFLYTPLAEHLSPYIEVLGIVAEASLMLWPARDGCERGAMASRPRPRALDRRVDAVRAVTAISRNIKRRPLLR
jgi:hypothetical protein